MKKQVLDHGYIELIESWGSDEAIIKAARMSTAKGFLGWGPKVTGLPCYPNGELSGEPREELPSFLIEIWHNTGKPSTINSTNPWKEIREEPGDEKLLRFLWEKKHSTPFEFGGLTIEVQAPLMVFREWHRHRTQSYSERSARYTPLPDANYVPAADRMLSGVQNAKGNRQATGIDGTTLTLESALEWQSELIDVYEHAERVYQSGLKRGVPKELARLPVPVGRYSTMRASANLRNWLGFETLRLPKNAQYEIRVFGEALHDILVSKFPRTMILFDEGMKTLLA